MATTIQDELYKNFLEVSGQQASALSDVTTMLAGVLTQVHEMQSVGTPQSAKTSATAPTAQANSSGDALSSMASTVLKSGFGLAPLVSELVSLFGGGAPAAPPPLIKYALPTSVDFRAAQTASGTTGVDYDQSGMARIYSPGAMAGSQTAPGPGSNAPTSSGSASSGSASSGSASGGDSTRQAPQITVNVQAMDARSFMDRSNEIALAVRDAMLNMNAINDVVNEL